VVFHEGLGDEEQAFQVYVENEVEIFLGDVPEFGSLFYSGVVDEDVDAAELAFRFGDEAFAVRNFRDIALNGDALPPLALRPSTTFCVPAASERVTDRHAGAIGDEALRDCRVRCPDFLR